MCKLSSLAPLGLSEVTLLLPGVNGLVIDPTGDLCAGLCNWAGPSIYLPPKFLFVIRMFTVDLSVFCSDGSSLLLEIKGIIFDMDGTLTIPMLRFKEMRARLGLAPNQDILPTVQSFPPDQRASAMAIIEEMEEECAKLMQVCRCYNIGMTIHY